MNVQRATRVRFEVFVLLVATLCFSAGCSKRENYVVIRILLPPASSPVRDAIEQMERFPPQGKSIRRIVIATMESSDDAKYRSYFNDVQTYRTEIVVVPTTNDIPNLLKNENIHVTIPCTAALNNCVAVLKPGMTEEERRAAELVIAGMKPRETQEAK